MGEGFRQVRGIVFDVEKFVLLQAIESVFDVYGCVCDVVFSPTALRVLSGGI